MCNVLWTPENSTWPSDGRLSFPVSQTSLSLGLFRQPARARTCVWHGLSRLRSAVDIPHLLCTKPPSIGPRRPGGKQRMLSHLSHPPNKADTNERTKTRKAERKSVPLDPGAGRGSSLSLGAGRLARGPKSDPAAATHLVVVFDQETRSQACLMSSKGAAVVGRRRQQAPHVDRQQRITRTDCRATESHRGSDSL